MYFRIDVNTYLYASFLSRSPHIEEVDCKLRNIIEIMHFLPYFLLFSYIFANFAVETARMGNTLVSEIRFQT